MVSLPGSREHALFCVAPDCLIGSRAASGRGHATSGGLQVAVPRPCYESDDRRIPGCTSGDMLRELLAISLLPSCGARSLPPRSPNNARDPAHRSVAIAGACG